MHLLLLPHCSLVPPPHLPPCPPSMGHLPTPPPIPPRLPLVTSQIKPVVRVLKKPKTRHLLLLSPPPIPVVTSQIRPFLREPKRGNQCTFCCSHTPLARPPWATSPRLPPSPPPRHQPNQTSCSPTPPTPLSGLSQIQKHPCLPFLGGYSQHSQLPQWEEPVHPSLLPHCSLSSNHASLKKIVWDRQKDSLPEAPPVPSDVAAPSSWGSAARRQPVLEVYLYKGWRRCRRPPGPVHHWTSVSPRAPPGPHPETAPKFTCAPTANPHGTEGFLRHFWGPQEPPKCAS